MRILYLAGEKLYIMAVPLTLHEMGHQAGIYPCPMERVERDAERLEDFERFLRSNPPDLLLSHTFYACAAKISHQQGIKYAVYGMDSPHYGLWQTCAGYDNVWLFSFDRRECAMLSQNGLRNVRYMPLAAMNQDSLIVTDDDVRKYQADISFVGSLYTVNVFDQLSASFPDTITDAVMKLIEESAFRWDGVDRITKQLERETDPYWDKLYEMFRRTDMGVRLDIPKEYLLKSWMIDRKLTNIERNMTLALLAERYDLKLYTRDTEKAAPVIRRFGEVDPETDALKVFYSSRINLNLTLRSIESGLPLRIFDIMSVGGFVLTDYREDAAELFEEDKEIVMYRSPEEMLDKTDYYLAHEDQRIRIGVNGYRKVKSEYSYKAQLAKILKIVCGQ